MCVWILDRSPSVIFVVEPRDKVAPALVPVAAVPQNAVMFDAAMLGVDVAIAVDVVAARSVADDSNPLSGTLVVDAEISRNWK